MIDYKEELKKFKPYFGKVKELDGVDFYFLRPSDRGSESELIEELKDNMEGSEDDQGNLINFKDYVVVACDGVYVEDGEVVIEQFSDIIVLNKETGILLHSSEGSHQHTYKTAEELIKVLS
ncbi:MAG: hypothetical protein ACK5FG_00775 [Chryseotalea sp.]